VPSRLRVPEERKSMTVTGLWSLVSIATVLITIRLLQPRMRLAYGRVPA
jgi:hypothetical protein